MKLLFEVAPDAGFEPATKWLTVTYSTAELIRNKYKIFTKKMKKWLRHEDSNLGPND